MEDLYPELAGSNRQNRAGKGLGAGRLGTGRVPKPASSKNRKARDAMPRVVEALEDRLLFARVLGIDISSFQSTSVNWSQVQTGNGTNAPGYSFAYAKATEGVGFDDTHFVGYMTAAHAAGMPIGAYHFARYDLNKGTAGADAEAADFWSVIKPYVTTGYMMPMLDLEGIVINKVTEDPNSFGYNITTFSQWAVEWVKDIIADGASINVKLTPVIYTGESFSGSYLNSTVAAIAPVWVAAYPSATPTPQVSNPSSQGPWATWSMWQYTDGPTNNSGFVYGLGGTNQVEQSDADVMQGDVGVLQNFIINSPGRFAANTRVTANTTETLFTNPAGTASSGSVASGQAGTVALDSISGETHAYANGFWLWHVAFDNGQTGWVEEYETPQAPAPHALLDWLSDNLVTNVSSTSANGTYGIGQTVTVTTTFTEPVTVTGSPTITLNDGGVATYSSGSGTNTLTFNYKVLAGQSTSDLDLSDAYDAISLNQGTIKDALGNYPDLMTAVPAAAGSLGANKNIVINGTAPAVTNVTSTTANGTYTTGAVIAISVVFTSAVTVTGTPQLSLNSGGTASYASGSGSTTLVFNYTVATGQTSSDLDYSSTTALALNGGTMKDAAGNAAILALPTPETTGSLGFNKNIVINGAVVTVTNVTSTSANGTYKTGALLPITVTFSAAVNVTGTPQLTLSTGAVVNYASGSGTATLTFNYTVAAGQNSGDLDEASTSALALNGGTINDTGGTAVNLALPAPTGAGSLGANKNIVIDTTPPTVVSMAQAAPSPTSAASVSWTVLFSENVTGVDTTDFALVGSAFPATSISSVTGGGTSYTVTASTNKDGTLQLNLGDNDSITDAAGNPLGGTGAGNGNFKGSATAFTIDKTPPTATYTTQTPAAGSAADDFTITYADPGSGVNNDSIGEGNITVTGPNAFSQAASLLSYDISTGIAVYEINAPSGIWNAAANGTYTISQNAGQVSDELGNTRPAGTLGTFVANDFAYASGSTLVIDYPSSGGTMSLSMSNGNLTVQQGTSSAQFLSSSFTSVLTQGGSESDTFTLSSTVTQPITMALGTGNDKFNIATGQSVTFGSDVSAGTSSLSINVTSGSVNFNSSQHLAGLTMLGGSAALAPGGDKVLVVTSLSMSGGAQLDLNDNAMVVNYSGTSPLPTVLGQLTSGFNGGAWNGTGIMSSTAAADATGLHALGYAENSDLGDTTFVGQKVDNTAILIRYTKYGDSNLDGVVGVGNDFDLWLDGYTGKMTGWVNGDYTYDGTIDLGNDFNLFIRGLDS